MSGEDDDYFSSIGNMFSGSQDPEEQNRALEREAEKRRREQEREQARLLREQQAQQAELQKSLQQALPQPVDIDNNKPASVLKTNPDDPLDGIPGEKRTDILLHKYDNRHPNDYSGQRLSPDRSKEYIEGWKKDVRGYSDVVRDVTLQMNMNRHPDIREQVEQARRQYQEWLPQPKAQTLELRLDDKDNPSNAYRTLEYRPERDGVPSIQKAIQYGNAPVKVVKADDNFLSQIMSVNIPQDESMGRAYDYLNDNAIAPMEGNESWKNNPVGHPDSSYAEAERQAGKAVTGYVNKALAPKNPVHGEDGSRPVSEPDQTTGKLIPAIFQNMDNETVGRAIQEFNEAQGYTYDPKHGSRQAYSFEKGMKMAPLEAKTAFYSFASLMGEMVYGMTGGDPKALRAVQDTLKTYQREMDAMKPMTPEKIIDPNDPEKTLQNVTDYLYQNLGNQIVKIPVRVLHARPTLKSMAEIPVRRHNRVFNGLFPVSPLYY